MLEVQGYTNNVTIKPLDTVHKDKAKTKWLPFTVAANPPDQNLVAESFESGRKCITGKRLFVDTGYRLALRAIKMRVVAPTSANIAQGIFDDAVVDDDAVDQPGFFQGVHSAVKRYTVIAFAHFRFDILFGQGDPFFLQDSDKSHSLGRFSESLVFE